MTKEDALQKIEELRQFVADLDSQKQLQHGNMVLHYGSGRTKRIIIDIRQVKETHLQYRYLVFDRDGALTNFFDDLSRPSTQYVKIRNVFDG